MKTQIMQILTRAAVVLLLSFIVTIATTAKEFITDVMVIGAKTEGQANLLKVTYQNKGWKVIDKDLNAGCGSGSDYIYLLYKSVENTDGLNHGYITNLYISNAPDTVPDELTYDNHTYQLVAFDGDDPQQFNNGSGEFKASKGNLNCGTSGVNIHLYYTRELFTDKRTVSAITFNANPSRAVGWNGGGQAADLNSGCSSGSESIYMHVSTATTEFLGYLKDVMLIGGTSNEVNLLKTTLTSQGWTVIDNDLNAGCGSSSDYIYLLYKSEYSTDGYNHDYITDFYISNASGTPPDELTYNGRTYHLVTYDGGNHFKEKKGDLNSNAGGDDIHLYYSKIPYIEGQTVSSVWFNNIKTDAVGVNGGTTGYNLNAGCSSGNAIYMHTITSQTPNRPEPLNLTLDHCSYEEATLTWEVPYISDIMGYTYQFKAERANKWSGAVTTTATSATISGLTPQTTYYFRVKTLYDNNESEYENIEFCFVPDSPYPMPTNLVASNLTDHGATLTWTAPDDASLEGFAYEYKKALETSWSTTATVSTNSVTLNNLSANTSYDFRVRALYPNNNVSYDMPLQFDTEGNPVNLPHNQGFEYGMGGWRIVDRYEGTGYGTYSAAHSGNRVFYFRWGADAPTQYLMSPQINVSSPIMVSFYYNNYSLGDTCFIARFHVGYSTTTKDPDAFTWSDLIESKTHDWELFSDMFPAETKYVAIKWVKSNPLYLDDFCFEEPNYTLSSDHDWNKWTQAMEKGASTTGAEFKLTADIQATTMMGTEANPFCGTFDGQGHKLTLKIDKKGHGVAPFCNVNGVTIKNLKTAGVVKIRGDYGAGLVGYVRGGTNVIENCVVGAEVSMIGADGGGIVGNLASSATTTIQGCVFSGRITPLEMFGGLYAATLVGFGVNGTTLTLKDCLDASSSNKPIGRGESIITISNVYYTADKHREPNQHYWPDYYGTHARSIATQPANIGGLKQEYGFVTSYSNGMKYDGNYYMKPTIIFLADNADNSSVLNGRDGYFADVTLQDRTLYKDGTWNTLCLPFSLSSAGGDLQSPTFAGTPLEGAIVKTLTGATFNDGTLTLNFSDNLNNIEAGKPYIIRWEKPEGYEGHESDFDITKPQFYSVTVSNSSAADSITTDYADFMGTYSSVAICESDKDKTKLYLGADNKLYHPTNEGFKVNACRAYFRTVFSIGDVNGDGQVNVTDVTLLVNHILGKDNANFIIKNADINGDGSTSITDVTALVDIILSGNMGMNVVVNGAENLTFGGTGNGAAK
ncbi:MAG: fibronectin type III domain-containing protein [Prevotella sp.]|nr:fibronectin type III domain-containing protein [Prevotella sp.]